MSSLLDPETTPALLFAARFISREWQEKLAGELVDLDQRARAETWAEASEVASRYLEQHRRSRCVQEAAEAIRWECKVHVDANLGSIENRRRA